jgi:hypothetical protein
MRQLKNPIVRYLILGLALVFATSTASADPRSDARTHYQSGVKLYGGGDYKAAIREFAAAQQLAPADLNNYNLALCYDKLGDPDPAIQYYRAYLEKVPGTDKKAEIEASISRLESAAKSVAGKRAEEARKAEDARKAAEAKQAAEDAKRAAAEEARRKEEEAKRPTGPAVGPAVGPVGPPVGPSVGPSVGAAAGSSTGTPSTGTTATTGDAQLDRVSKIDINQVRDQRVGGAASGIPDKNGGPAAVGASVTAGGTATASAGGAAGPAPNGAPNAAPNAAAQPNGAPDPSDKPKATPVYKKWWFWAVVAVSAYVVYSIATDNSQSSGTRAREEHMFSVGGPQPSGGLTLMRW